jgi:hypothetical protein
VEACGLVCPHPNPVQAMDLDSSNSTSMIKVGYMQTMTERARVGKKEKEI